MNYNELSENTSAGHRKEGLGKDKLGYEKDLHELISDTNTELGDFEDVYDFKFDIGDIITDIKDNGETMDADYKIKVLQNLGSNLETTTSLHGEDIWFESIKDKLIAFSKKPSTNEYEVDELFVEVANYIKESASVK